MYLDMCLQKNFIAVQIITDPRKLQNTLCQYETPLSPNEIRNVMSVYVHISNWKYIYNLASLLYVSIRLIALWIVMSIPGKIHEHLCWTIFNGGPKYTSFFHYCKMKTGNFVDR